MSKATSRSTIARQLLPMFIERYPNTFAMLEARRQPLKVGIRDELAAVFPDLTPRMIGVALYWYANAFPYRAKLVEGAPRFGLDGQPAGTVTASEAADAAKWIETVFASIKAKRIQRAQARNPKPASNGAAQRQTPPTAKPTRQQWTTMRDALAGLKAAAQSRKQLPTGR
jgi:ProP effector